MVSISPRPGNEEDGSDITNFYMTGGVQVRDNLEFNRVLRQSRNNGERDADGLGGARWIVAPDAV